MSFQSNFALVPLGEVARFINGDRSTNYPKGGDYVDDGTPFISATELREGRIDLSSVRRISTSAFERLRSGKIQRDDVLFCLRGSIGKIAYVKDGEVGAIASSLVIVRASERIDSRYLFFGMSSQAGQQAALGLNNGAAQPNLSVGELQKVPLPLPPIPIQRRISSILSAYDDLIENSQRRIKILESMARALYREWFVHFRFPGHENHPRVASPLGEIPEGWKVEKLGEISSYINRGIAPQYDEGGESVVINQKCVRDQRVNLDPARRQSKAIPSDKKVLFGDVLINSTGVGTLGRVAQVYEELENCTVDTHVTIARAASNTDLDYYGCCLLSHQETFERLGIGATGQTELGRGAIAEIELVVPPTEVQRQFGVAVNGMRLAAVTYGKRIQNLRRTRDLLLPRLLSGQIALDELEAA